MKASRSAAAAPDGSAPASSGDDRETPVGALGRGLAILNALIAAPQPSTLSEVSAAVQLEESTVLRFLRALEQAGYVLRTANSRRYVPSPRALTPLPVVHSMATLRREVRPLIGNLSETTGETVVLVLFLGDERVVIDIARSASSLAPYYSTWLDGPLHCSGSGKALLSTRSETAQRALLGPEPYAVLTPNSKIRYEHVARDLETAARTGYVVARNEHYIGLTAIAAVVWGAPGRAVGCLVITGHSHNLDADRTEQVAQELVATANLLPYHATSLRSAIYFIGG